MEDVNCYAGSSILVSGAKTALREDSPGEGQGSAGVVWRNKSVEGFLNQTCATICEDNI